MSRDPPPPSITRTAAATSKVCGNCYTDDCWILHNVKHRGIFKKICTSCVLKLHPSSFCPTCFSLHDPSFLISGATKTLTCFKCSSLSHSTCVPPNVPKSPYLCLPCSNPSFKFFDFRKNQSKVLEDDQRQKKVQDERLVKVLLAASKISLISMKKAAATARDNAERRGKEAALCNKRVWEAIELVIDLSARFSGNKRREHAAVEVLEPVLSKARLLVPVKRVLGTVSNVASTAAVHLSEKSNGNQLEVNHGH